MSRSRRVVVTGLGVVSPFGVGMDVAWNSLLAGKSGLRSIGRFEAANLPSRVAGEVPGASEPHGFNAETWLSSKDQKKMARFIHYGIAATEEALSQAGFGEGVPVPERAGVLLGSGTGGLPEIEETCITLAEKGPRRISPFFIPAILINLLSGQVSIRYNLKGPNSAVVTACATGAHAVGEGANIIRRGDADIMVAGGAEACISALAVGGFAAARALSTGFNDTPQKASRPFDAARDGFVIAEGAGVLVLEELEHAQKRGADILAEVLGFGQSGDAYHITQPAENGDGCFRAMSEALCDAALPAEKVGYINAHATSTPAGDVVESRAIERLFGRNVPVSATKSMTGHMLGAAGSFEAAVSVMALHTGHLPPTINLEAPGEGCNLDYIPNQAREAVTQVAMSNSFGFGGTNTALIFGKI